MTALRDRLAMGESVLMPGVWDALTATLAARAGFHTVFVSGFAVSGTLLAEPDIGLLTQTEMADVARRIGLAVAEVDVVVDADTGYGNAINTIRTVELWDRADWLSKLRAACEHRTSLHVTARTDARAAIDLDDAIERGRMARDCGVDAVFVEAPESIDEMARIAAAIPDVTLVANMVEHGRTPLLTPAELADLGFRLIVSPVATLFAAVQAMQQALATLQSEGSMRDSLDRLVGFQEFTTLVGLDAHRDAEARYRGL
jgi:2,3-dimethylmalate lyase